MRKIPTLFVRQPPPPAGTQRRAVLLPETVAACRWVMDGEGQATRKWDGHCVRIEAHDPAPDEAWSASVWSRREVKPGKNAPPNFEETGYDQYTGKRVGWQPYSEGSFHKQIDEALARGPFAGPDIPAMIRRPVLFDGETIDCEVPNWVTGTYELVGPEVNGNPERFDDHRLILHGAHPLVLDDVSFIGLRMFLDAHDIEGIVWHHPDGRRAKLKGSDFGLRRGKLLPILTGPADLATSIEWVKSIPGWHYMHLDHVHTQLDCTEHQACTIMRAGDADHHFRIA